MLPKTPVECLVAGHSRMLQMSSSVYLLKLPEARVLLDNGERSGREALLLALQARGLKPADIDIMVYTHLHMDHCWNHGLFSRARTYFSAAEERRLRQFAEHLAAAAVPPADLIQKYLGLDHPMPSRLLKRILEFFDTDQVPQAIMQSPRIAEDELAGLGLRVWPSPGHTSGHTAFAWDRAGQPCLFTGDAIFCQAAFKSPASRMLYNEDLPACLASKAELEKFHGWIYPGHGPEFFAE